MSLYEIIWAITLRSPVFIAAVLLQTLLFCRGYSQGGSQQQILALLGDDVILPCSLKTPTDASHLQLEWARTDLSPGFIHIWEKMKENVEFKQPSYVGRTSLSSDKLKHGDVSLTLSKVQLSDEGPYRCFIPQLPLELFVDLIVGSVSAPVMKVISNHSSRVVLQCESAGWYPEPELLWLDGEGNLLSARPTETLRGPDDLYTVSSSVTVEKRHSNNITCRVQQKNINQSRETHIHVPDDVFMVMSPSSPPSDPSIAPIIDSNTITGLAIGAVVVLVLILAVSCVVWKQRRFKCRNKKKSEEDGPEQTRKETMTDSKNDNREFHVVVAEGESEPLMAGREREYNPQDKRINPSVVVDKESLNTIEKETEKDVTGRQETNDVGSRGEQSNKDERETEDHQEELKEGLRRSEEEKINPFILTEKESQSTAGQETHEEQEMRGRGMKAEGAEGEREKKLEGGKDYSGLQFFPLTEEPKEQPVLEKEEKSFNLTSHLNTDQKTWREKEKQKEQLVERRQRESDESRKTSDTEKRRSEEERRGVNKIYSISKAQKKTREHQREKLLTERIKKNRNSSDSSKVTANTDLKTQEKEPEERSEQSREEIREQPVFLAGAESFNFTFHLNTDQNPWREKEKQQPEKQRRAQSEGGGQREMMKINEGVTSDGTNRKEREKLQLRREGALQAEQQENVNQKEEPEEPVSVTERGVDCLEEPQKEELRDETPDVDQHNMQSRKHTQEIKLHEVCNLPAKKQKIEKEGRAKKHQNVRKVKTFVNKQNDDHMEVDDAAHSQCAAITQQHETMKWTNEQQMLSEQKETQEYLREHDEDQMEVEEHSGLQFPPFTEEHKEQPLLLAGAESFNFTFHLNTHQKPWREKETQQKQFIEKRQRESDLSWKRSDTEKKRAEEERSEVNKIYSGFRAQKKTQEHQREKLESEHREENQRKKQSETRMERETQLKIKKANENQQLREDRRAESSEAKKQPNMKKEAETNSYCCVS